MKKTLCIMVFFAASYAGDDFSDLKRVEGQSVSAEAIDITGLVLKRVVKVLAKQAGAKPGRAIMEAAIKELTGNQAFLRSMPSSSTNMGEEKELLLRLSNNQLYVIGYNGMYGAGRAQYVVAMLREQLRKEAIDAAADADHDEE